MSLERFSNINDIRQTPGLSRGVDWNQGDVEEFQLEKLTVRPDEKPVVEIHIYTPTNEIYLGGGPITDFVIDKDKLYIDYSDALKTFNIQRGFFKINVNVYYNIIGTYSFPELVIKEIAENNREILVSPIATRGDDDTYEDLILLFLERYANAFERDFALNFGNNRIIRLINFKKYLDNDKILAMRLYSPLPDEIDPLDRVQLIELASDSYVDNISLDQLAPAIQPSNLRGPNFNIETGYTTITETDFKSWSDLLTSNTATSQKIVDKFFSGSAGGVNLGIDYSGFANYVHYGSAKSRIDNFRYKLQNIEFYDRRLGELNNISGSSSGSLAVNKNSTQKKKDALIGEFDAFETWLYNEPTSSVTTHGISGSIIGGADSFALTPYPKRLINSQYVLHQTTGSLGDNWYLNAIEKATIYDEQNPHQLLKSIPEYIRLDSNNSQYEVFVNMIGQHFDILWTYANALTRVYKLEENPKYGIDKDVLVDIAKSQGWELTNGYQASQLFRYTLGTNSEGTFASTGSLFSTSDEELTGEVWRRIVNNLPYILKSRGTERGIKSLLNIYGIPQSLLSIREYGGPKVGDEWPVLTEDRYSYGIQFNSGSYLEYGTVHVSASIDDWGRTDISNKVIPPITREFRFRPSVTQSMILYSQVNSDGDPITHIGLQHTQSMSGSTKYGRINLAFASASGTSPMTASTAWVPLYNGDFWNLKYGWTTSDIHFNTGSNTNTIYTVNVQHASDFIKGKVVHTASLSITPTNNDHYSIWSDASDDVTINKVRIGGNTGSSDNKNVNAYLSGLQGSIGTFSGSMQEYREWLEVVDAESFNDHTLNPTSYVSAITPTSSYDTLIRHYTLGSETIGFDLSTDGTIISSSHPNQSIKDFNTKNTNSTNATTVGFIPPLDTQRGNFIPVEETYFVRGASLGANNPRSQKIRLENNDIVRRLSPTNTSEVSSFDNAPLDSNKLGLFYSFADQVNKDIFNHTGRVELDDYIGDPDDEFTQAYSDLRYFSREYWKKFTDGSDVNAYNRIFSQFDFSIFSQIKQTLPERVDEATGLLVEPNILERSKVIVTKPIKVEEPFYDAFFESPKPTGSGDANLQYDAIIDNGETTVITPSSEMMDRLTAGTQVFSSASMRYCTIETPPVDELVSYTASYIDSNYHGEITDGTTAAVIDSLYDNQDIPASPVHNFTLQNWTANGLNSPYSKLNFLDGIRGDNNSYGIKAAIRVSGSAKSVTKQIRVMTDTRYPYDVLVKGRIYVKASQSFQDAYQSSGELITPSFDLKSSLYIPETQNDPESRILRYLDIRNIHVTGPFARGESEAVIPFEKTLIPANTNVGITLNAIGTQGGRIASSSITYNMVTGSFIMNGSQEEEDTTIVANETSVHTNARGATSNQPGVNPMEYFDPGVSSGDYTGYSNIWLSASNGTTVFYDAAGAASATAPIRDITDGSLILRHGFKVSDDGANDNTTRLHFVHTTSSLATFVSASTFVSQSTAFTGSASTKAVIHLDKLQTQFEIHEVCHTATKELYDECRKSSIYETVVYHYSGSPNIDDKYDRDFDAAVSESKYLYYSRSLTPSCYRDDAYRYSIQHMATLGTQLTAPSINAPSVNAALGNLPVVEIFEVNPNQIFYNRTPAQPSRGNRLDPGNLSVR